jgi:hypothetical protein
MSCIMKLATKSVRVRTEAGALYLYFSSAVTRHSTMNKEGALFKTARVIMHRLQSGDLEGASGERLG